MTKKARRSSAGDLQFPLVAALAGGVGGARLADGLAQVLPAENLTVIVNTGDDFEHLGLYICPDLDTVCYTLAGIANPATGWGRAGETWQALESLGALGGPTWFRLGDRDLGMNLERTRRRRMGAKLSQITTHFCRSLGVRARVLPMSDDAIPTWVMTDEGNLPFQEYFVHRQCQPRVSSFQFVGAEQAHPAPGVLEAIQQADLIIFCPSNPWVSIDPILAVLGIRQAISRRQSGQSSLAVSPIIGGQAIKGPAAKMFTELGLDASALEVARHYTGLLDGFILDQVDALQEPDIQALGLQTLVTDTVMRTNQDRVSLAKEVIAFGSTNRKG
jgi:LPPG:FO 2-phospho-L-lactate transferase